VPALILFALLAAPVTPTHEGTIYDEHEPAQHEGDGPTIEAPIDPVAVPLPEPEPPLELEPPPPPAALPPLAEPQLPPPPPPPDGSGRLVGGTFAVVLGVAAASAVMIEVTRDGGNPQFVAATFVPLGLASIGIGTYLLVRGAHARRNYNDWRVYAGGRARPTGSGLLVGGTMSTVAGGITLVAAGVSARRSGAMQQPLAPSLFAIGAAGVGVGVGGLTWGLMRRNQYRDWRQSTFLGSLTPTIAPLLDPTIAGGPALVGASVGLGGRM
jgi:hypothetical protein